MDNVGVRLCRKRNGGQLLICIAGRGWYQEWGKTLRTLQLGDIAAELGGEMRMKPKKTV